MPNLVVVEKNLKEDPKREGIYVMQSFLVPRKGQEGHLIGDDAKRRGYEEGCTILWKTLEDVEHYLEDLREGRDDRPFELRWNILVVEKVYFGPYSYNEVVGWWRAEKQDNGSIAGYDLVPLDKCPLPGLGDDDVCNFTIGT